MGRVAVQVCRDSAVAVVHNERVKLFCFGQGSHIQLSKQDLITYPVLVQCIVAAYEDVKHQKELNAVREDHKNQQ